jgi:hypothetical protein
MTSQSERILSVAVSVLAVLYLAFQIRNKRWSAVVSFCLIAAVLCGGSTLCVIPCGNWQVCVLVAIVASNVVSLPHLSRAETSASYETFESDSHKTTTAKKKKQKKNNKTHATESVDEDEGASDSDDEDENEDKNEDENEGKNEDNAHSTGTGTGTGTTADSGAAETGEVDTFSTFMETYRSLTPDQIESMTTDTRALITTQQDLMKTVKSLSPVITQGKEMMDTFKDYFGPGSTSDLLKAFKSADDKP